MAREQDKYSTSAEQGSSPKSASSAPGGSSFHPPTGKPATDWEQPDFEELDLCMEVTTYIYNWQ